MGGDVLTALAEGRSAALEVRAEPGRLVVRGPRSGAELARRLRVNAWINGSTRRVLKLRRDALEAPSPSGDREGREGGEGDEGSGAGPPPGGRDGAAPGTDDRATRDARGTPLPALPGLPGFGVEDGGGAGAAEEVLEWAATL